MQLPFQIPSWQARDISESISRIISKGLKDSELEKEFDKQQVRWLIVKAVQLNPREVKRFINNTGKIGL